MRTASGQKQRGTRFGQASDGLGDLASPLSPSLNRAPSLRTFPTPNPFLAP